MARPAETYRCARRNAAKIARRGAPRRRTVLQHPEPSPVIGRIYAGGSIPGGLRRRLARRAAQGG